MSLKHGLLGLLNYEENGKTGYDLDKTFKASLNFFWQAQASQIYRELNAMEKQGLVHSEIVVQTDKPNKRLYFISATGKAEFLQWLLQRDEASGVNIRNSFLMRIFFAGNLETKESVKILEQYKERCLAFIEGMQSTDTSIEDHSKSIKNKKEAVYWKLSANFGNSYAKMCLAWTEESLAILEAMS